jgi:uncharacterized protein YkwD
LSTLQLTRRGFIVLGAAFGLSACGEYVPTTVMPAVSATPEEMLAAINDVRQQNGGKPLTYSALLASVARGQANAMVAHDQMSHDFGPGMGLRDRATLAGYHGPIGENVAAGQTTVEETLNDWLKSPGHRFTLLSDMWTSVGMVVVSGRPGSKYGVFWAADFGTS